MKSVGSLNRNGKSWLVILGCLMVLSFGGCSQEANSTRNVPVTPDGRLAADVGMEIAGGQFLALLDQGCTLPCETTVDISTAVDNQEQIAHNLMVGPTEEVEAASPLGHYQVTGLPASPRGEVRVEVILRVEEDRLSVRAQESGNDLKVTVESLEKSGSGPAPS